MTIEELQTSLFKDNYIDIAIEEYLKFKETENYNEKYKRDLLSETNDYLKNKKISSDNVVEIVKYLRDKNPQHGSLVHWTSLDDFINFAKEHPSDTAELLNSLFDSNIDIKLRIDRFIDKVKDLDKNIKLGTPLFGYILASYDRSLYPLYRDEMYRNFLNSFGLKETQKDIAIKYFNYTQLCQVLLNYFKQKKYLDDPDMLDMQDFIFCLSNYDNLSTKVSVRYIYKLAEKIHSFSENDDKLIDYVNSLTREYLDKLYDHYRDGEKVNYVRLKIIEKLLNNEKIDKQFIEIAKQEAKQKFGENVLRPWKNFNILFPFFYEQYYDKTNIELKNLYNWIKAIDVFKDYNFKKNRFISDFYGGYTYGRAKCKIALYPDDKDNHRIAAQLFLQIGYDKENDHNQITYGLQFGDELRKINNNLLDDLTFVNYLDDFDFNKLKQKLINVFERFKEINKNTFEISHIDEKIESIDNEIDVDINNDAEENNVKVNFDIDLQITNLIFEQDEILKNQITTALRCGKHIILVGPPGTGKSKLAKIICDNYKVEYMMATATSDWSTYDTIGGYKPNTNGQLYFDPGLFLQLFKDRETKKQSNKWLIIDEINRADIDKAFGSIFSALTGDDITLHFKEENGKNIMIKSEKQYEKVQPADNEYIIPSDWRIIGTMNTYDKTSLYEMSYAFMRRFAFVPINVPSTIDKDLINKYLKIWKIEDKVFNEINLADGLTELWIIINKYRIIGPAIIEDIAKYVSIDGDYTSAIIMYALPQFEGLSTDNLNNFLQDLNNSHIKNFSQRQEMMINFVNDYFNI